jgi:hypothetical protein
MSLSMRRRAPLNTTLACMDMPHVDAEGEWLSCLDPESKALFLASLVHELTIAGRESYEVQGLGLTHPKHLRESMQSSIACLLA